MHHKDNKLNAIKEIIKITGIYSYKEVIYFINKYIAGDFDSYLYIDDLNGEKDQPNSITNSIISEELGIENTTKASKVLSNLMEFGIVIREKRNEYKVIRKSDFKKKVYRWVSEAFQKQIENPNIIYNEDNKVAFFKKFDFYNGIKHYKNTLKLSNHSPANNVYNQYDFVEFLCREKWGSFSASSKEILNFTISKEIYNQLHDNYNTIKEVLNKKLENEAQSGVLYYIISTEILHKLFFSDSVLNEFPETRVKDLLLELTKSFKEVLFELKEFMTKNKLLIVINQENIIMNSPFILLGPYIYQIIYENLIVPPKISILYFYNEQLSKILQNSYLRVYKYLEKNQLQFITEKKEVYTIPRNKKGILSYNASIKKIDQWNEIIKNL
ncbi:MAG: hypothetical protein EU549_03490 [Promethearchaeota archaeon]|nr:MAG: hypothetical protein EU549_03490 [Candidatus Lokiarchaeota archaeon]